MMIIRRRVTIATISPLLSLVRGCWSGLHLFLPPSFALLFALGSPWACSICNYLPLVMREVVVVYLMDICVVVSPYVYFVQL